MFLSVLLSGIYFAVKTVQWLRTLGKCKRMTRLTASWPVVSVFNVEEEEGACHEHAQDSDSGQDAVKWYVDMAAL